MTEGESAFNETSGSSPLSIRQQALRGIAKCALERGDKPAARHQYERILGKALIGQGPPAAHWAHSEYAWLLFEDGNLEVKLFLFHLLVLLYLEVKMMTILVILLANMSVKILLQGQLKNQAYPQPSVLRDP